MSQLFAIPQPHLYLTKRKFPGVDLLIYSRYSTKMPINFYSYFKLAFNFSLSNFVLCFWFFLYILFIFNLFLFQF